jgi:DNA-binding LacI/PurR family transcriptional regulator
VNLQRHHAQPFYEQLKEQLRQKIAAGEFKPDAAIPDERSLAAELGISRMTARRAIVELSDEGLLKRVRGKGTFVRGSFAPQPRTRRACVGIVAPFAQLENSSIFYHRLLTGVYAACEQAGLMLGFRKVVEPCESFVSALRHDPALKALIVVGIADEKLLRQLVKLSIPTVLLDTVPLAGGPFFDEVNYEAEQASFAAVSALVQLGHREIAMMQTPAPNPFFKMRQAGYERALRAAGLPVRPELIHEVPFYPYAAYAAMRRILQAPQVPTAFFCIGDDFATAVITAVLEHGWRVPRDLSVIGFGDLGFFSSPWLSTVRIPMEEMGLTAVKVLAERLARPTAPLKRVLLPCEWIARASCDCPRQAPGIT